MAKPLTEAERRICTSLKHCIDIVERHDASEYDYAVLTEEFRRFDTKGRSALFEIMESDHGTADIAQLIADLGLLSVQEQSRLKSIWSLETADVILPLIIAAYPETRHQLYHTLAHENPDIRENARLALLDAQNKSDILRLGTQAQSDLLSAMAKDPMPLMAPVIANFPVANNADALKQLLKTDNAAIVAAAYDALYKHDRNQAFQALLNVLPDLQSRGQILAVGDMLAARQQKRTDNLYAQFAIDLSDDSKLPPPARAVGLHVMLKLAANEKRIIPELTPTQNEAFEILLTHGEFLVQDVYGSALPLSALERVWKRAVSENWINRDRLAEFYLDTPLRNQVIRNLITAKDTRSFEAGLHLAKPGEFSSEIRAQASNPVKHISSSARQHLGLKISITDRVCDIPVFDIEDITIQMPFFDSGWMQTLHNGRTSLNRKMLETAHPTKTGWLAGYALDGHAAHSGGGVLHYDNRTGEFSNVGRFLSPIAIIPDRPLALGEATNKFWVVDGWGGDSVDVSIYTLELSDTEANIRHLGVIPFGGDQFGLSETGDLFVGFDAEADIVDQPPLRFSSQGRITSACDVTGRP